MYGTIIAKGINFKPSSEYRVINWRDFQFAYNPLPKFENDHLFFETDDYIVLLGGVILNKDELMQQYGRTKAWQDVFWEMIENSFTKFMTELRGSSCRGD